MDYHFLRKKYTPSDIKLVLIVESPPKSGKYFYEKTDKDKGPLFFASMKFIGYDYSNDRDKEPGLRRLQEKGIVLVDATYEPVDGLKGKKRDEKILERIQILKEDLRSISTNIPIIIVKKNVHEILYPLLKDEFNILNLSPVPFPSNGWQKVFAGKIAELGLRRYIEF